MFGQLLVRNDEEKQLKLQRVRQLIADCVNNVAQLRQFSDVPRYRPTHIRNLYAYMLGKLQHSPQIVELVRTCNLPLVQAVR